MGIVKCVSIIIPLYNEEESVVLLHDRIQQGMREQGWMYEIIYVDDGSTDTTWTVIARLANIDACVRAIQLSRNFGQTAALAAGVAQSSGDILVFMDGDLQNDPADIPHLLSKLQEGYDVVSGWRKYRRDPWLSRKLPSLLANRLISHLTSVHLHDYGCTLKAYRREIFQHLRLYGEMHRFLPAYAALYGAKVTELPVQHHPRRFGSSKYGLSRTIRVILDLMTLKFLGSYATKPIYAFGFPGLVSLCLSLLCSMMIGRRRLFSPYEHVDRNPLLPVTLHFAGVGMLCVMMGLLAEMVMRTYYESQQKTTYSIKAVYLAEKLAVNGSMPSVDAVPPIIHTGEARVSLLEQE